MLIASWDLILRIGVNGFENPLRDAKTEEFKKQIGSGCKLKMDDTGMKVGDMVWAESTVVPVQSPQ